MSKLSISAAAILTASALAATPVAAHPENDIKPAGQCDRITPAQWNQVRNGMSLEQVEHITGCHASHHSTNNFKAGPIDNYFFRTGSRNIAEIKIKGGKLWQKFGYHSGL
ncbi:hypothetical protein [Parasphingorhabdus halotolerans]|uniref:Uncharacterized protein n=1 Tax=Parasphingorhabdus halotolerans TaxID=2725558 RepID=A0A6H2DKL8_9SPHN|nr:hypothetical protein [Parasphingorhabdus halotolerans]QJB68687.1 hypothetical protein HF685_04830 [Parasphingorhabdus halotolerans]